MKISEITHKNIRTFRYLVKLAGKTRISEIFWLKNPKITKFWPKIPQTQFYAKIRARTYFVMKFKNDKLKILCGIEVQNFP